MEWSISAIQVTLNRRSSYHGTPDNGLGSILYRNLRFLCSWLWLRCVGWLSRTREPGLLRRGPRNRSRGLLGWWHRFRGWPSGGVSALRRNFPLRWGNGRGLNRSECAAPMAARCGRGVGEDGEAERPPLVFAMAEMKGGGCSRLQRLLSWCAG